MTQHRLGQEEAARVTFAGLRKTLKYWTYTDEQDKAIIDEAEAALLNVGPPRVVEASNAAGAIDQIVTSPGHSLRPCDSRNLGPAGVAGDASAGEGRTARV